MPLGMATVSVPPTEDEEEEEEVDPLPGLTDPPPQAARVRPSRAAHATAAQVKRLGSIDALHEHFIG